ncbi:MAG: hypothetical protein ACKPAE_17985 [Microcystis panniformis]
MSIWGEHHIFEVYPKTGTQQKNLAGGGEMQRNRIAIADLEVKAATLEAKRAELERIRIRKSSLQASRFVVTTSVVPDYNRFFKTGFGLIDISKK